MHAVRFFCIAMIGIVFAGAARADLKDAKKDVAKYDQMFQSEANPVKRAKIVVKLGRAEYKIARSAVDSEDWDSALAMLQDYNEKATAAETALDKSGIDAEKHSNGFRQLQISVRESARQLRDITGRMPFQQRGRFRSIIHDLDKLNQTLLMKLFPHRPHKAEQEAKNQ